MIDWLEVALDPRAVGRDRGNFNQFMYHDVAEARMPIHWMRSAVDWAQLEAKIGPGYPRDAQHAAYLFEADVFLTADRRFRDALERVRPWAPRPFAHVHVVGAGGTIVEALRSVLTTDEQEPAQRGPMSCQ